MTPSGAEPSHETSIDAIMASIRASVASGTAPGEEPTEALVAPVDAAPPGDGATVDEAKLDALMRSMLAPMLKDWLDAHLPEIVETATHAEIRRLTGRTD